jgi:hypothetical protein
MIAQIAGAVLGLAILGAWLAILFALFVDDSPEVLQQIRQAPRPQPRTPARGVDNFLEFLRRVREAADKSLGA